MNKLGLDTREYQARVDLSLAERLAKYGGDGTDCSIPLREANARYGNRRFAGCVLVSDSESWVYRDRPWAYGPHGATGFMSGSSS